MDREGKVAIAIMTVDREPQYVHQTIASLLASGDSLQHMAPIHLVVGSSDSEYLQWYEHHRLFQIHSLGADEWEELSRVSVWRRICHTAQRSLRIGSAGLGVCVLEDDMVFADGFVAKLGRAVAEIQSAGHQRYILSGYAPYNFDQINKRKRADQVAQVEQGQYYRVYSQPFYGSCCLFYSRQLIEEAADFVLHEGFEQARKPYDTLIGQRYRDEQRILFVTRESLAQHIGEVSSHEVLQTALAGGRRGRLSPTFAQIAYKTAEGRQCDYIAGEQKCV